MSRKSKAPLKPPGEYHAKVDLTTWHLEAVEDIADTVRDAVRLAASDAITHALTEPADIYFPALWDDGDDPSDGYGGKPPKDPTTLYIRLPLGSDEDHGPMWELTLTQAVDDLLHEADEYGVANAAAVTRIRDGLQVLVDKLTAALDMHEKP